MTSSDPKRRLLDLLGSTAAYNDKGFSWSGHDAQQVRLYQEQAQRTIMALVEEIGEPAFGADLLGRLKAGEGSTDASGDLYFQLRDAWS